MRFRELENILLKNDWSLKGIKGSHNQYIHPTKKGKVTLSKHGRDLDIKTVNSILKQAGLNKPPVPNNR